MKNIILWALLVPVTLFAFYACWTESGNDTPTPRGKPTAEVSVYTRSGAPEVPPLLPIYVYAFDEQQECYGYKKLTADDNSLAFSFALPAGTYTLCAVAGAVENKYTLPDSAAASLNALVSLLPAASGLHSELQTGRMDITLLDGEMKNLTLMVTRIVAQVTGRIIDIPESVTAITMSLQPLHSQLCINGTFNDAGTAQISVALEKNAETGNWQTPDTLFVFPGEENLTIGFTLTDATGEHSYAYNMDEGLQSNYKYSITATYVGGESLDDGPTGGRIDGNVNGVDWAGERPISFEFGEGASTADADNLTRLSQGDFYNGAYILRTEGDSVYVLLSHEQWMTISPYRCDSIADYTFNGMEDWDLFSYEDAVALNLLCKDHKYEDLNEIFEAHGISPVQVGGTAYLYRDTTQYTTQYKIFFPNISSPPYPDAAGGIYYYYRKKDVRVE